MRTNCLVTSIRSNKVSSLVESLVEMKAFFCDETDDVELDIDALMLAASQHYERTLLTPSQPNVRPNLVAPCSIVQLSVVSRPRLSSIPRIPRVITTPPGCFQWQSCIFTISFPTVEISLRGVESDLFSTRYAL